MDLFASKNLKPMLFYEGKLFNSEEYIYEIKFDGHRTIIYLDHNYINIRSRNNKDVTSLYPELNEVKKLVKRKCILDGELIILENGKPNFFKMQKRSLMTNTIRIKQESINNPVIFIAFDILYYDQKDLTNYPLIKRKEYLEKKVKENDYLIISKYVEYNGIELFKQIKKEQLEGIVAKRKDSIYQVNKRVHDWLKIKCIKEKDFYVLGIREENKKIKTIVIGSIKNNKLILFIILGVIVLCGIGIGVYFVIDNNKKIPDKNKIQKLFDQLTAAFERVETTKEDIVKIMHEYLPEFQHMEAGKSLDSKM